jgi:hypothetical protein
MWVPREIVWIQGGERKGQIEAVDALYRRVRTAEIFHAEDDWWFEQTGTFIQDSRAILKLYPKVIMVSLRGNTGWHDLINVAQYPFLIAQPNWKGGWGGFAFNPGMRRRADWERIGCYADHVKHGKFAIHEEKLSILYQRMGYVIADLGRPIARHLGQGRSCLDEFADSSGSSLV